MSEVSDRIKDVIENEPVALFMNGTPQFVMCGNSDRALRALREAGAPVTTVDVLADPSIRQELSELAQINLDGLKEFNYFTVAKLGDADLKFKPPVDYWLAHDLRPLVDDVLSESQVCRRGLFRPEEVRRYVDEHRRGAEDWSMQIWQLLTLEIWMQLFMDGGAKSFAQQKLDAAERSQPISGARLATA